MIRLPQEFLERIRCQLGGEYESFLACCSQDGYTGLRVNTQKVSVDTFLAMTPFHLAPVPWTTNGFYYRKEEPVTRHPHYYAGLYYIQEPSAMLPASVLPVAPGDRVLDLCAAPGGKATELSLRLQGKGLLVANDVSPSRAKALLRNLAVWGAGNCCITAETPQRLLESFGCFFDKILVDAPCSGEGMFRRDASLSRAWQDKRPEQYAGLQKEILSCAVRMLRPDGYLVYSTCTFSETEDEDVIEAILGLYPDLELCSIPMQEGFAPGRAPCEKCVRIWPHRVKGEGHFTALLHKRQDFTEYTETVQKDGRQAILRSQPRADGPQDLRKRTQKEFQTPAQVSEFLKLLPEYIRNNYTCKQDGERCFLLPQAFLPEKLRYLRTGILAGTLKRDRFEPSQALAMLLDAGSFPNTLNLSSSDERVIRYLKGETIEAADSGKAAKKGWILVCADGFALGWGKYADGSIKNKYDPGWRLQR